MQLVCSLLIMKQRIFLQEEDEMSLISYASRTNIKYLPSYGGDLCDVQGKDTCDASHLSTCHTRNVAHGFGRQE
jgi:hypothetical protein